MVALLTGHARRLSFGLLTAFSSSVGQTFFIALSVPYVLADLSLGEGRFGLVYAGATLVSGLSLPMLGRLLDRVPLVRYTTMTLVALTLAAALMAWATHLAVLALALVGLRLAGQGLLGHISQSTMAREFEAHRGKALGVAGLGYPLGEAVLPGLFLLAVGMLGWRYAWALVAVVLAAVVIPAAWWMAAPTSGRQAAGRTVAPAERQLTFADLMADPLFRRVLPAVLVTPLLLTALFLYQALLGQTRGWSAAWLATAFTGYAVARAVASLAVGPVIDRYTARILVPLHLLPMLAALVALSVSDSPWVAPVYLALVGVTAGASSSVLSALWAEVYGPSQVAAVRSVTAGLTVVSTAVSPAMLGLLLERGVGFQSIQLGGLVLSGLAAWSGWRAIRHPMTGQDVSPAVAVAK